MDAVFKALADRNRRKLLDRLHGGQGQSLSALCAGMTITRQSVTQHLQRLEAAGLVVVAWQGREKLHYLNPVPIAALSRRWIDKFSATKLDAMLTVKTALEQRKKEEREHEKS